MSHGVSSRKQSLASILLAVVALATAGSVEAQERWTLDVRAGAAIPTGHVAGHDLGTGLGLRATVGYRFLPQTAVYADWDWHRFSPEESFAGADVDFEEAGYALGLGFEHPFSGEAGEGPAIQIRVGGTYQRIELEDSRGGLIADSGHGVGWEAGAGIVLQVTERLRLTPGLRYRSLSRPVTIETIRTEVALRYVSADLAMSFSF